MAFELFKYAQRAPHTQNANGRNAAGGKNQKQLKFVCSKRMKEASLCEKTSATLCM